MHHGHHQQYHRAGNQYRTVPSFVSHANPPNSAVSATICQSCTGVSERDKFRDTQGSTVPYFVPIPGDSDDAPSVRTRGELASALVRLMHAKTFDAITPPTPYQHPNIEPTTFSSH